MSTAKKLFLATAILIAAPLALFPAISGHLLQSKIEHQIRQIAAINDFSVSSMEITPSFNITTIDVVFKGEGGRQVMKEELLLTGNIRHNDIRKLPEMFSANLRSNYSYYDTGVKIITPGTLQGTINWDGFTSALISTDAIDIPVDTESQLTMRSEEVNGTMTFNAMNLDQGFNIKLNKQEIIFKERDEPLYSISFAPSDTLISSTGAMTFQTPELVFSQAGSTTPDISLKDIKLTEDESTQNNLLNSSFTLETGQLSIPVLEAFDADDLVEGIKLSASFENFSTEFFEYMTTLVTEYTTTKDKRVMRDATRKMAKELSRNVPSINLEEFSLKTVNGDISVSATVQGEKEFTEAMKRLSTPGLSRREFNEVGRDLLLSLNSSATLSLSDDMMDWSCTQFGEQMALKEKASVEEARMMSNMCQSMADSGDFMSLACMDIESGYKRSQCLNTMEKIKVKWAENKSLELALKKGEVTLNGAAMDEYISL